MKKIYYYPSCPPEGYANPYSLNYKKALEKYGDVLEKENNAVRPAIKGLVENCLKGDLFVLNWIEGICNHRHGYIQYIIAFICLFIIRLRKRKIVWTIHNMSSHSGTKVISRFLTLYLYRHSNLIITHSKQAESVAKKKAHCPVYYVCHPFNQLSSCSDDAVKSIDVLIWGSILPYKGIPQFLQQVNERHSKIKILIVGSCTDKGLVTDILKCVNENSNIVFDNRKPDFSEVAKYISSARYVLFPYIGHSVSSSGALMDTIVMGGTSIGPNVGAFKDLCEDGICLTYENYNELFNKLESDVIVSKEKVRDFIKSNSWENYARFVISNLY